MHILIAIPHGFQPVAGSALSSQTESKRALKRLALGEASLGNLNRLAPQQWLHLYHRGQWITQQEASNGHRIELELHTTGPWHLLNELALQHPQLRRVNHQLSDPTDLPLAVSRSLLERADQFDLVVYLEDDIAIQDRELFDKVAFLVGQAGIKYVFMPHRCETKPGLGDVVLAGEPTEARPHLPWATGEELQFQWLGSSKSFRRVLNPHAGCFFLTRAQAVAAHQYWARRQWQIPYQWAGKMEMACTGIFLPIFRMMKIRSDQARCFQVRHEDCLWQGIPAP